jgi:diguanylate cyclase (GGDEF)-like protein
LSAISVRTLVQRKTRRYRRANRKLEARISERTRELREANRLLAELATEDALTGVANRRALEQGMQREWMRCMDQRRPLSALMIDIDHFKQFNDRHGHLEGDHCLAAFAQLLRNQHNPDRELLARYGGEEFALLLPGLTLEQALGRAGNLHASIAASDLGITVSIGVAGFIPDPDLHPEKLLEQANAALYHAKRTGRNRVESAPGEASDPG